MLRLFEYTALPGSGFRGKIMRRIAKEGNNAVGSVWFQCFAVSCANLFLTLRYVNMSVTLEE